MNIYTKVFALFGFIYLHLSVCTVGSGSRDLGSMEIVVVLTFRSSLLWLEAAIGLDWTGLQTAHTTQIINK